MSKTSFAYPVEKLCGKISKDSKVIHACTASGKQITYLQGERDLVKHPVSPDEIAAKTLFTTRTKRVAARVKSDSATYAADIKAFMAQKAQPGGIQRFKAWLWADEMSKE